ncbi:MAG: hypothetical protein M1834_003620 [Cirrosporium novae-zelandiae]|nr:MAG: hypothetical protein M1834_003620 [Cirrosporium novae-zelandiae]
MSQRCTTQLVVVCGVCGVQPTTPAGDEAGMSFSERQALLVSDQNNQNTQHDHNDQNDQSDRTLEFAPSARRDSSISQVGDYGYPSRPGVSSGVCSTWTLMGLMLIFLGLLFRVSNLFSKHGDTSACDTIDDGYQCQPETSHLWGQYSPYFAVPSEISTQLPDGCRISFVQLLSRHGGRDPTSTKTILYNETIQQIISNVQRNRFSGRYAFLANYKYNLGADRLTVFGENQMVHSGIKFFSRYQDIALNFTPFIRAGGSNRVIESALKFSQGYHAAKQSSPYSKDDAYPYPILVIPETDGENNTLSHGLCTAFEDHEINTVGAVAQQTFLSTFAPPITSRLNRALPNANLSLEQTIYLMDLCPFASIASPSGSISPFCSLFTGSEWEGYNYYQSLGKYYGYGGGNPLGPTQGVGFVNELISRMTDRPVKDHTSVNKTLDSDPSTFPLGPNVRLYADFSHDNDMIPIFSALNLFNNTSPLSNTSITDATDSDGFSAAWAVPFAGRAYFEKMRCDEGTGLETGSELVRILINDRVVPLNGCEADELGRCEVRKWIASLGFAKRGGHWDMCWDLN